LIIIYVHVIIGNTRTTGEDTGGRDNDWHRAMDVALLNANMPGALQYPCVHAY
jgi:hypothetical protein